MIFVCIGSRDYQFDRLIKKIDDLVADGSIKEKVVAQIGASEYIPEHVEWHRFLDRDVFSKYQEEASLIISHGGTGALIGALKKGKQVIAVPRLAKYGEHIDDHQTQVSGVLDKMGYLRMVLDMETMGETIQKCQTDPITKKYDIPSNVISIIEKKIETWFGN